MKKTVLFCLAAAAPAIVAVFVSAMPATAQIIVATVPVGSGPTAMAINANTNKIYVVNCGGACPSGKAGSLTVIDGATNSATTIPTGNSSIAVAVNPNTNKIYVANEDDKTVTVVDGATNSTTTIPLGSFPVALAVDPNTNKIYVINYGSDMMVIDGATDSITTLPIGPIPNAMVVNPSTNKIYVTSCADFKCQSGIVTVIDGATNATTTVPVGPRPLGIDVNSATDKIYVANYYSNTVTVIDGATNATTDVTVGEGPGGLIVNPVTNKIYVNNFVSGNITVIDGASNSTTLLNSILGGNAINEATDQVYAIGHPGPSPFNLTQIDGVTNYFTPVLKFGRPPGAFAIVNSDTNRIYLADANSNTVTVINGGIIMAALLPGNLNFGSHALHTTTGVAKVSVKNAGLGRLMFSNIAITGADAGDFAETNTCTGTMDLNQSCVVDVTFTPSALGARSAALTFADNGQGSPQTVPLSGSGVQQAVAAPSGLKFAAQTVGTTSAAKTVTFTNNLTTALAITITFTGTNPGDFVNTNAGTCGSSVPARSHCTISVAFAPKAGGTRTATLRVNDTASNSPQSVTLSGTGN